MWSKTVHFVHEIDGLVEIDSTLDALVVLDKWWQKFDGPAYREAINACIGALQGKLPDDAARIAFVMALTEGGVESV
ncbi:DUF982 domain-containing protein [Paracoccus sp. YIM 132242]|uniref:DUF982 domain-containing protein n=1 Tax=Paracoccus lichenicola TaxID=2665644 RepID=A0A6L6HM01_9RHOB|nr:DUF982 domain-containing protein [Paracoccus lichenicola]MTD99518.1 DUF982 domain-containing protein [Paracoccus lichenicola]